MAVLTKRLEVSSKLLGGLVYLHVGHERQASQQRPPKERYVLERDKGSGLPIGFLVESERHHFCIS